MSRSLAGRAGRVGLGILVSRVMGVVREQVFAYFLGAGLYSDAFLVAFRVPNLLRDLFAEGALSAGFVPVFSAALVEGGRCRARAFLRSVTGLVVLVLVPLVVAGMVFAPAVVGWVAPGFGADPVKSGLTVRLVRILMPFILFQSFAALAMGSLNSLHSYLVPSVASAVFNAVSVAAGGVLAVLRPSPVEAVVVWTWGALLGGAGQWLFQVPSLVARGFAVLPSWPVWDADLRRFLGLVAPAVWGLAATQVNILVNTVLASKMETGSVSWLNYAFRLVMLPIGVFGVAIGTVSAVESARSAAERDLVRLREGLAAAVRLSFFLSLPATAGFWVLGRVVVATLYEHGRFGPFDTERTVAALALMSAGLFAYTAVKVVVPVFYALGESRVPAAASTAAVAANLAVSLGLWRSWGYRALAFGTAAAAVVNLGVLSVVFGLRHGGWWDRRTGLSVGRSLLASAVMGVVVHLATRTAWYGGWYAWGKPGRVLLVAVLVPVGVVVYGLAAWVAGSEEVRMLAAAVGRRLKAA